MNKTGSKLSQQLLSTFTEPTQWRSAKTVYNYGLGLLYVWKVGHFFFLAYKLKEIKQRLKNMFFVCVINSKLEMVYLQERSPVNYQSLVNFTSL
jgi:hypothetical protein